MESITLQKASDLATVGSSYRGRINTTHNKPVEVFGQPHRGKSWDNKVQAEWAFMIDGAVLMTIYDYKAGEPVRKVTDWHIGGFVGGAGVIARFLASRGFRMEDY